MLYLIRHADAGTKHGWTGRDADRPLDRHGRIQAAAIVPLLAGYPLARAVSSGTARCVQTVEPLARRRPPPV